MALSDCPPIVVCTVNGKCLPVLQTSISTYAPTIELILHKVDQSTFGQSYNSAMAQAFKDHDSIIISNDDVVLTPSTYQTLLDDVDMLIQRHGDKLGFVAACSDNVRWYQNIIFYDRTIPIKTQAVSPLFAWISKQAFEAAQFPHINWFSDDLICEDLNNLGFSHYVSRSYVHHAGSQTIGGDARNLYLESIEWIRINRPEYYSMFKRGE